MIVDWGRKSWLSSLYTGRAGEGSAEKMSRNMAAPAPSIRNYLPKRQLQCMPAREKATGATCQSTSRGSGKKIPRVTRGKKGTGVVNNKRMSVHPNQSESARPSQSSQSGSAHPRQPIRVTRMDDQQRPRMGRPRWANLDGLTRTCLNRSIRVSPSAPAHPSQPRRVSAHPSQRLIVSAHPAQPIRVSLEGSAYPSQRAHKG